MFEVWLVVLFLLSFGAVINILRGSVWGYFAWGACCWIWMWGGIIVF